MQKFTKFIFFLLFCMLSAQAQDIILKKNGDEINAKVLEIGISEIKYKLTENPDGPLYSILKLDVFMIKYANGTKEVMKDDQPKTPNVDIKSEVENKATFAKGTSDANFYYKKYAGAATWNFVGGFFLGVCALPIPIATGSSMPQESNLGYPNPGLFQDANYRSGYMAKAKKIKQNKVWANWGAGCVSGTLVGIMINVLAAQRR